MTTCFAHSVDHTTTHHDSGLRKHCPASSLEEHATHGGEHDPEHESVHHPAGHGHDGEDEIRHDSYRHGHDDAAL